MFLDHFGLATNPFGLSPRLDFLYHSAAFQESMAHMVYGVDNSEAIIMITGSIGTGKTMAVQSFMSNLGSSFSSALVTNTKVNSLELLKLILEDLDVAVPRAADKSDVLILFKDYLIAQSKAGKRVLIVIDEAQNLSAEVLEEIRLLTNLGQGDVQPVQLILLGQPELVEIISVPGLAQLRQRIRVHYHLDTLTRDEVEGYVNHRMRVAGCERPVFSAAAMDRISEFSGGVPRLVNSLCGNGLLSAFVADRHEVLAEDIDPEELMGTRDIMATKGGGESAQAKDHSPSSQIVSRESHGPGELNRDIEAEARGTKEERNRGSRRGLGLVFLLLIIVAAGAWAGHQGGYFQLPFLKGPNNGRPDLSLGVEEPDKVEQEESKSPEEVLPGRAVSEPVSPVTGQSNGADSPESIQDDFNNAPPEDQADTALETPTNIHSQPQVNAPPEVYEVHIASFKTPQQAEALVERVRPVVGDAFMRSVGVKGGVWYRVYLGPFASEADATAMVNLLKQAEPLEYFMVMKIPGDS